MSRTGQRQALRPRPLEGNECVQASASKRRRTSQHNIQESQAVSASPEPGSSASAAEAAAASSDDVDGDVSTLDRSLVCSFSSFRSREFQAHFQIPPAAAPSFNSPLPNFSWADSNDVWKNMLMKDIIYQRDPGLFRNHQELHARMRSILFDWLSEVCEVYRIHKETFTLAVDFIDRYLSVTKDIPKTRLQLIGISALFLAAKLEEIYPPKLSDFAYVTDNACTEQEIVQQEMIIVKALKWDLSPMTTNAWLGVFLQMANMEHITDAQLGFVFPQFSTHAFIQLSRLCHLSLLDAGSLKFRYSIIAASALYHHTNENVVAEVSGLTWADIYPCVKWMAPFARAILDVGQSPVKFFPTIAAEDCHNIQAHNVDMALLDRALAHQLAYLERERLSPSSLDLSAQLVRLLMPVESDEEAADISMGEEGSSS